MSVSRLRQAAMAIVWPAFLMAGVLEMLVFSMVDPGALHGFDGERLRLSSTAIYSLAFFVFWAVIAAAGALSHLLSESATEINSRSFR
jgi:hypothetical protein